MGMLMAAIVVVTMLGLVYLTPTLGTNATSTEIGRLEAQLEKLDIDIKRNEVQALEMTQAEAIIPQAKKQDLKRLDAPRVLTAP
jgi:cell division protein FtsL